MSKFENVTWKDVDDFVDYVHNVLILNQAFNISTISGVYGIPRGGLVLAVMLSHRLDVPLLSAPAEGCLIVDDICDSGESLLHYVKNSSGDDAKHYIIATMYRKQNANDIVPDISYKTKDDKWIVFPWEHTTNFNLE